jgi:hypothetical protein
MITRISAKVTARTAIPSLSVAALDARSRSASNGASAKSSRRACRLALTLAAASSASL